MNFFIAVTVVCFLFIVGTFSAKGGLYFVWNLIFTSAIIAGIIWGNHKYNAANPIEPIKNFSFDKEYKCIYCPALPDPDLMHYCRACYYDLAGVAIWGEKSVKNDE